jgi:toxin CcdB
MARFDVYPHPDPVLRKKTPYLLDVQNNHISRIATRVVVPMRPASLFSQPMRDLNPTFEIAGKQLVLDTAALAAVPSVELKKPVLNLAPHGATIVAALDVLFGAY